MSTNYCAPIFLSRQHLYIIIIDNNIIIIGERWSYSKKRKKPLKALLMVGVDTLVVGEFASRTNNACKANVINPSATLDFKFVCWGVAEQRNKKKEPPEWFF